MQAAGRVGMLFPHWRLDESCAIVMGLKYVLWGRRVDLRRGWCLRLGFRWNWYAPGSLRM